MLNKNNCEWLYRIAYKALGEYYISFLCLEYVVCDIKSSQYIYKGKLLKHNQPTHEKDKTKDSRTEFLSNNEDAAIKEYFETDVKSEVDSDTELDRTKELKHELLSDNGMEGMEEYFETEVKSKVE